MQIKFYENWSKCLVKELIQGFPSEDEALGDGVCFAVAVRWALSDGFHLPTSLKSFLAVPSLDSIKAQDRYYQAFYEISSEKNLKANEILNNKIPYLQEFELNEVCYVDSVNCTANDFSIKFKEILHSEKFINKKSNPGVGLLIQNFPDSAHAIYFRYDPHLGVYRFGDPNVGLFQFNNEEEFLTCFQDLITLMYDNLKSINIRQVFQK